MNPVPTDPERSVVRVVIRYDDCSAKSSFDLESDLVQTFADCSVQATFGVVPFVCAGNFHDLTPQPRLPLTAKKSALLSQAALAGHLEVALHGYCHQRSNRQHPSELAGLLLAEQRRRIHEGKQELECRLQIPVTTLIPPWNAYDEATLEAMKENGLGCLSASLRGPFRPGTGIMFLPASCWLPGLSVITNAARRFQRLRPVLVVLLHDYDFRESGHPDAWLTVPEFARRLHELACIPDVRFCSLAEACRQGAGFSPEQLIPQQLWRRACVRLSWRYRTLLEDQVLWARGAGPGSLLSAWYYQAWISGERVLRDLLPAVRRRLIRAAGRWRRQPRAEVLPKTVPSQP